MSAFNAARARAIRLIVIAASALLLGGVTAAQTPPRQTPTTAPAAAPTTKPVAKLNVSREEWHAIISRKPLPKAGCFKITYPEADYTEVPCGVAPKDALFLPELGGAPNAPSFFPPKQGPAPQIVGGGTAYSAQSAGLISATTGSWDDATTLTAAGSTNNYSLQINTSFYSGSTICGAIVGCQAWQQFVFSNSGYVVIQSWLLGHPHPCPATWTDVGANFCVHNSATNNMMGVQPFAKFKDLQLTGEAVNGGNDTLRFFDGTTMFTTSEPDTTVDAATHWNLSEYNVFGNGGGGSANFNAGSHLIVRIAITDGTANAPTCSNNGFTGETNNFNLVLCCPYGGNPPHISFDESTNANPSAVCINGTAVGDTHLTNFNKLYYDFQATGDFLLAQKGPDFVVQNRQISGAPSWPNAAVNKYIGMKMGNDRVAVCTAPNRLVVNGKDTNLADGATLALPGVFIGRTGNIYTFTRPNGDNVRTTINSNGANTWINVAMGFADRQPAIRGLLGNSAGNGGGAGDLVSSSGTVLHQPIAFNDLYHVYGDSWRVSPRESLPEILCVGGTAGRPYERSNPQQPFFAADLKPADRKRAQAICLREGITEGPYLNACILDTVVLGGELPSHAFLRVPVSKPVKLDLTRLRPMQQPPPLTGGKQ